MPHIDPQEQLRSLSPRWKWENGAFRTGRWTIIRCANGSFERWVEGSPTCVEGWDLKKLSEFADRLDATKDQP